MSNFSAIFSSVSFLASAISLSLSWINPRIRRTSSSVSFAFHRPSPRCGLIAGGMSQSGAAALSVSAASPLHDEALRKCLSASANRHFKYGGPQCVSGLLSTSCIANTSSDFVMESVAVPRYWTGLNLLVFLLHELAVFCIEIAFRGCVASSASCSM